MNKKILATLILSVFLGSSGLFALGIGLQGGFTAGGGYGSGAVTFKLDSMPWVFAANGSFGNALGFGITADKWIANKNLTGPLNYFYGWGLAGSFFITENYQSVSVGARILGGLNMFLLDNFLELYLQGAWQPEVNIGLSKDHSGLDAVLINFPINLGFRFWLK